MATKKNGRARGEQPSKPSRRITEKVEHVIAQDRGMTIREEMATAAMQGILAGLPSGADYSAEVTARTAVEHADALLAELAKGGAE